MYGFLLVVDRKDQVAGGVPAVVARDGDLDRG
jgi:hypothetical protein